MRTPASYLIRCEAGGIASEILLRTGARPRDLKALQSHKLYDRFNSSLRMDRPGGTICWFIIIITSSRWPFHSRTRTWTSLLDVDARGLSRHIVILPPEIWRPELSCIFAIGSRDGAQCEARSGLHQCL